MQAEMTLDTQFEIDLEFQALCPPPTDEEFEQLENNILSEGCRDALVVWDEGNLLLDGHNRYKICSKHGLPYRVDYVSCASRADAINWIIDNQLGRRNLTPQQASYLRGKRYNAEKLELGTNQHNGRVDQNDQPSGPTVDRLASQLGVSRATIQRDAKFADSVDAFEPDVRREILSGNSDYTKQEVIEARGEKEILEAAKRIRQAKAEQRREERVKKINEIARNNAPLEVNTERLYPVIYADPPWRYEHSQTISREIENQYPTMSLDEICDLPVGDLATPDAVLFMWATSPKLEESLRVVNAWGFTYRTCIVWDKERIGMGYYARQQHELLLICTRGNLPVPEPSNRPASVVRIVRAPEHSAKPVEFYDLIERMYPEYDRIELFARNQRDGWEAWGNQANE